MPVLSHTNQIDRGNYEDLVWEPTLAVLHKGRIFHEPMSRILDFRREDANGRPTPQGELFQTLLTSPSGRESGRLVIRSRDGRRRRIEGEWALAVLHPEHHEELERLTRGRGCRLLRLFAP